MRSELLQGVWCELLQQGVLCGAEGALNSLKLQNSTMTFSDYIRH